MLFSLIEDLRGFEDPAIMLVTKYITEGTTGIYHIKPVWQESFLERYISNEAERLILTNSMPYIVFKIVMESETLAIITEEAFSLLPKLAQLD